MLKRISILILFIVLVCSSVLADSKIITTAEIDIYGTAKIQHEFQEPVASIDLKVYSPESLDVSDNVKFAVTNDTLQLTDAKKGTRIVYLSKTLAKKEGDWKIQYISLNPEAFKLILPFSAAIKEATGTNVRSKDKTGQVIEWGAADNINVVYDISPATMYAYKTPFFAVLILFILLAIYAIYGIINRPTDSKTKLFIEGIEKIDRPLIKRVIFAILISLYGKKENKWTDQASIRRTLSKEGFKDISSHKGEISDIVNKKLSWLIDINESKILIKKSAEKKYKLSKNAKQIIKIMRKENLIEKDVFN